jgi:hypothetical protein
MKAPRPMGFAAALAAAALAAGCASTQFVSQSRNDSFAGAPFRKVLVVTHAVHDTPRQIVEDELAQQISGLGAAAIASRVPIPDRTALTDGNIAKAAADAGADAILVCRLAGVDTRTGITAGSGNSPPTLVSFEVFSLEVRISDAKTGQAVWSAVTETAESSDVKREIARFAALIARQLRALKLI